MKYVVLLSLLIIVGCNRGSNPTENYKDLKTVPKHDGEEVVLNRAIPPFSFRIIGETDSPTATIVAGTSGVIQIQIIPDPRVKEYTPTVTGLDGAKLLRSKNDPNIWELHWTPSVADIPNGLPSAIHPFRIQAYVKDATNPALNRIQSSPPQEFFVTVIRVLTQPKIIGVSQLSTDQSTLTQLDEGSVTPFTVLIEDPSSTAQNPPSIVPLPCKATDNSERAPRKNGSAFIDVLPVVAKSANRFEAPLQLNLKDIRLNFESNEFVDLCFQLGIQNDAGAFNAATQRVVRILPTPKAPKISLNSSEKIFEVRAGYPMPLRFEIDAGKEAGELKVTHSPIAALPGEATFECEAVKTNGVENKNHQECSLYWLVSDEVSTLKSTYSFKVEATHTVIRNGKNVSKSTARSVNFKIDKRKIETKKSNSSSTPPSAAASGVSI